MCNPVLATASLCLRYSVNLTLAYFAFGTYAVNAHQRLVKLRVRWSACSASW